MMRSIIITITSLFIGLQLWAQPVPGVDENIPYLVTFGDEGETAWGDDNFCQMIFFAIPEDYTKPVYIRVYDPDTGGDVDEIQGAWNTRMKFSVYGGLQSCSHQDVKRANMDGNYDSGTLLVSKTFGNDAQYNKKWYSFGPINPTEGEYLPKEGGHIFKVIIEGTSGDDGNLYRLFLSSSPTENRSVEGAFAYYFRYKFRMHDDVNQVSHIYPYIDKDIVSIKQANFDWDSDGVIRVISVAKNGEVMRTSGDNEWKTSEHMVVAREKNSSWDIQMIKNKSAKIINNNVVIFLENQYGESVKFYSAPIGGIPRYMYNIGLTPKK